MNNHNKLIANQYNVISKVFDSSRVRIWNNVKIFLLDNETYHNKNVREKNSTYSYKNYNKIYNNMYRKKF